MPSCNERINYHQMQLVYIIYFILATCFSPVQLLIVVTCVTSNHSFYVCHPVVLTAIMKECFQKKVHNVHQMHLMVTKSFTTAINTRR